MGKKSNAYILLYHSLIPKKLPQVGSEISDIHNQVWEPVTAVWRNAWRDAGVYMNYNNQYKCNGSYIEINHLYLPETILTREYEVGKNLYTWKNVLHIKEKYNGDGTYTVTRKKDQGNLSDEDLIEKMVKKNHVDPSTARKFLLHYRRRLLAFRMQEYEQIQTLSGYGRRETQYGHLCYFLGPLEKYEPEAVHRGALKLGQHTELECIFFIATVCSLLKTPMSRILKNNWESLHFVLYVYPNQTIKQENYEDYLDCMSYYSNLYCNYRRWHGDLAKSFRGAKFWYQYPEECNSSISLASWNHLCFPVIFSDYENVVEDEENECDSNKVVTIGEKEYILDQDNTEAFPKAEQSVSISNAHKYLKKLSCLPIFLLKESALGKARKGKEILSLKWNASNIPDVVPNEVQKHRLIMDGYVGLLEAINEAGYEVFRRYYFEASKSAYKEIGVFKKDATREQQYCATLMISLLIANQYAAKNTMFWVSVRDSLTYLRTCVIHHADTEDFARFVKYCTAEDHEILFYQDADGIYLHYKQYWPAFQKYCKENRIILTVSAAHFRKNELSGYLKPQYNTCGSKYLRYDYRKKVDGREATVLNVSPSILRLIKS